MLAQKILFFSYSICSESNYVITFRNYTKLFEIKIINKETKKLETCKNYTFFVFKLEQHRHISLFLSSLLF